MNAIEKRARELLAEALRQKNETRLAGMAEIPQGLDQIATHIALDAIIAALTPPEGCALLGIPVVFDGSVASGTFELRKQQPKLIGWRMADYTYETADRAVARGWACKVSVLPIFEGDRNTGLAARPEVL